MNKLKPLDVIPSKGGFMVANYILSLKNLLFCFSRPLILSPGWQMCKGFYTNSRKCLVFYLGHSTNGIFPLCRGLSFLSSPYPSLLSDTIQRWSVSHWNHYFLFLESPLSLPAVSYTLNLNSSRSLTQVLFRNAVELYAQSHLSDVIFSNDLWE